MAGVLEGFFRICLVLSIMLLGANFFITAFGEAMTGQGFGNNLNLGNFSIDDNVYYDVNIGGVIHTPNVSGSNVIEQSSSAFSKPIGEGSDWDKVTTIFAGFVAGWQQVVIKLFSEIGSTSTEHDQAMVVGGTLIMIVTLFQLIGGAYLLFALWSTFVGGGSP